MRFLGRKVYLAVVVILVSALEHGLSTGHQKQLIKQLGFRPQTPCRWRGWWRETFPTGRFWQQIRSRFIPPIEASRLPGALLGRLYGDELQQRLCRLLRLLAPLTTHSWSGNLKVSIDPQKM